MYFVDNLRTVKFISAHDDSERELLVSLPLDFQSDRTYPLIISPHPFGWSHLENFSSGAADLLQPFKGWTGLSDKYKLIIALPLGHGRVHEKISLGWIGQIEDVVFIPEVLEEMDIHTDRVYLCGLSMGGMETLTALGMYPDFFRGGFIFNAIADLANWYEDIIQNRCDKKLIDSAIDTLIVEEVGGTPSDCPEEYQRRSAINFIDNFAKTNLMIYWSRKDSIVVNQESRQSKYFYDLIKSRFPHAKVYEHDHSKDHEFHAFDAEECIRCHEFSDFEVAVKWLLSV